MDKARLTTILRTAQKGYITYLTTSEKEELKNLYKELTNREVDMNCGSCILRIANEIFEIYERQNNKKRNNRQAKRQS
ncbi:MAG: hypothetical protein SNG04_04505 [Rikenellaceae bacterium]